MEWIPALALIYMVGVVAVAFVATLRDEPQEDGRIALAVFWPFAVALLLAGALAYIGQDLAHWCLGARYREVRR